MRYKHLLINDDYYSFVAPVAKTSTYGWLCGCGLQEGSGVYKLLSALPKGQILVGSPQADDGSRDKFRTQNSIRYFNRVWGRKHEFRESLLTHYKFHLFFNAAQLPRGFVGSMNMTANRWNEVMIEVELTVTNELTHLFSTLWRNAKEVSAHKGTLLQNFAERVVKRAMDTEK